MCNNVQNDLLLVIDMQNVYLPGGHWACEGIEAAAERICELIGKRGSEDGGTLNVALTRFDAAEDATGMWRDYNEVNASVNADVEACEMIECFAELSEKYPLYSKSVYSAADIQELMDAVSSADRVLVSGVVAECCVLATVMALIDKGVKVVYLTDAVAGESVATAKAVETVLAGLDPLHVERMTVEEYLNS